MDNLLLLLASILADINVLTLKTHGFHWNVQGPDFYQVHLLFDRLYGEISDPIDRIAEDLRAFRYCVPASLDEYEALTTLPDMAMCDYNMLDPQGLVRILLNDVDAISQKLRALTTLATQLQAADSSVNLDGIVNLAGELSEQYGHHRYLLSSTLSTK